LSLIRTVEIGKKFGSNEVMRNVSMTAEQGEVIAVIGPSGAGKSTLLRALCGLETITDGEIYIDDELLEKRSDGKELEKISTERRKEMLLRLGMVFQRFNLFPHKTAKENVMLAPVNVKKLSSKEASAKADALLARVGLSDQANEYPSRLSGGQQQRVAIARALAMEPEVMLFDEPTSALDPELVGEVLTVMSDLAKSGTSMIVVTHEMGFAREAANKVIFMCDGELAEEAAPAEFFSNPKNPRAQQFLRSIL
jgi:polar amino acid transport system ATP-binding protein